MPTVSVVVPGRNCAETIASCLASIRAACRSMSGWELIFVDDGSVDGSAEIAAAQGAAVVASGGRGPGAARNVGWRRARGELVWFVDSDCEADARALELLLPHLDQPEVCAVGGAYDNACPDSRVATWIHEEIAARHRAMPEDVDFLASFSVVYRRSVLEELGGFDERYLRGQDADLSFRALRAGHRLRFEVRSRVAHHHERRLFGYLRAQYHQGYWRAFLHMEHRGRAGGDSYSRLSDHLQPPVALLSLLWLPTALVLQVGTLPSVAVAVVPFVILLLLQVPMVFRIGRATALRTAIGFALFSALRAYWRGIGFARGCWRRIRIRNESAPVRGGVAG